MAVLGYACVSGGIGWVGTTVPAHFLASAISTIYCPCMVIVDKMEQGWSGHVRSIDHGLPILPNYVEAIVTASG